jgi:hypothetical protein
MQFGHTRQKPRRPSPAKARLGLQGEGDLLEGVLVVCERTLDDLNSLWPYLTMHLLHSYGRGSLVCNWLMLHDVD